ncbi:MAG: hypothetical protein PUB59_04550, partial [Firmicutes bacterium]|nr:hypothetical protein [Bacillota bacterium]
IKNPENTAFSGFFFLISSDVACHELSHRNHLNKGEIGVNLKKWVKKWANVGNKELAYSTD